MKAYAQEIGFKELSVNGSLRYYLGRRRLLIFSDVGTPNEMVSLCQHSRIDDRRIDDVIVIHNYDYDGLIDKPTLLAMVILLDSSK